jgi:hypothetical protein
MSDLELTLPGSIPGLLRRCSPIVVVAGPYEGWRGVAVEDPKGCQSVLVHIQDTDGQYLCESIALAGLALDLTDATGRTHAMWWWAGHNPCHFSRTCGLDMRASFGSLARPKVKYLDAGNSLVAVERPVGGPHRLRGGYVVRSLADLHPNDPRLLPDGSRWVDAKALQLVCAHVGGSET